MNLSLTLTERFEFSASIQTGEAVSDNFLILSNSTELYSDDKISLNNDMINVSALSSEEEFSPETHLLSTPPEFPNYFKTLLHVLYSFVLIGGTIGNSLVLYVIYSVPRMRTVTNYLLANLAVGDLIIATLCVPFTYLSIIFNHWPFGRFLCYSTAPFNAIGVLVSAFTLIALAIEKYIAILHPLAPRLRKSRVGWVIGIIWFAACVVASPIAFVIDLRDVTMGNQVLPICHEFDWGSHEQELGYSLSLMMIQYFIPLAVLSFTYTKVAQVVWGIQHDQRKPSSVGSNGEINLNRNVTNRPDKGSRKAVLLTLAVVAGYTLAWLPLNVEYIIRIHCPHISNQPEFPYIYIFCHWLAMSHCFYNPIIYNWMNNSFKNAFKDVLKRLFCFRKNSPIRSGTLTSSRRFYDSSFTKSSSSRRWTTYRKFSCAPEPCKSVSKTLPRVHGQSEKTDNMQMY